VPKIIDEKIHEKEPYISILNLLRCGNSENAWPWPPEREKDPRFQLTHGEIFECLQSLKEGEQEKDLFVYRCGLVKRGCIKKEKSAVHIQLIQQLNLLIDRGFIERIGESKHYRYSCTGEYIYHLHTEEIISRIKSFKRDTIYHPRFCDADIILYGIPPDSISLIARSRIDLWTTMIYDLFRQIQKNGSGDPIDFYMHVEQLKDE
jgi:hypothetical protein